MSCWPDSTKADADYECVSLSASETKIDYNLYGTVKKADKPATKAAGAVADVPSLRDFATAPRPLCNGGDYTKATKAFAESSSSGTDCPAGLYTGVAAGSVYDGTTITAKSVLNIPADDTAAEATKEMDGMAAAFAKLETSVAWKYNDGADKRQIGSKETPAVASGAIAMTYLAAGAFAAAALF